MEISIPRRPFQLALCLEIVFFFFSFQLKGVTLVNICIATVTSNLSSLELFNFVDSCLASFLAYLQKCPLPLWKLILNYPWWSLPSPFCSQNKIQPQILCCYCSQRECFFLILLIVYLKMLGQWSQCVLPRSCTIKHFAVKKGPTIYYDSWLLMTTAVLCTLEIRPLTFVL